VDARILLLPGDGIGPEVTASARAVLERIAVLGDHRFQLEEALLGGCAIDATGNALPADTLARSRACDAILLGAVGGLKWSDPSAPVRPEQGLLALRKELELFANLRPVPVFEALRSLAPLRPELLAGVDLLIVRELTGGIYFGPRKEEGVADDRSGADAAYDTLLYSVPEVERVARVAFAAAQGRKRKITSIDKANVLASMRLWRRAVERVALEFPDVELEHQLVDSMAMHLMTRPARFDVVLAGNMFGDILSDEAAVLAGSLGMLPSASLGAGTRGLYEPVHGSAPDIAGRGIANPLGAILSAAMLLRHSLGLDAEAAAVERAVAEALERGLRTADLVPAGLESVGTEAATSAVLERIEAA
jgi:3-isopropylmalate dehydrogenase